MAYIRDTTKDLLIPDTEGNLLLLGAYADSSRVHVLCVDYSDSPETFKVFAFNPSTGARVTGDDFTASVVTFGYTIFGDSSYIWIGDDLFFPEDIDEPVVISARAFRRGSGARVSSRDFNIPSTIETPDVHYTASQLFSISNGSIVWYYFDDQLIAFSLSSGARVPSQDFSTAGSGVVAGNGGASNGTYLWGSNGTEAVAFLHSTKARATGRDVNYRFWRLLAQALCSTGNTLWAGVDYTEAGPSLIAFTFDSTAVVPTARAGADRTVVANTLVTLDGSASLAGAGTISSYNWRELHNAPPVGLSVLNAARTTFTPPVSTVQLVYSFVLTVFNSGGAHDEDFVRITVPGVGTPEYERATAKDIQIGTGNIAAAVQANGTVWFVNDTTNTAMAWRLSDRARDATKDIALGTGTWRAACSDGTTLWFVNTDSTKTARAYRASDRGRDTAKDITLPNSPARIYYSAFSDGTHLWFIGSRSDTAHDEHAHAYLAADQSRVPARDISSGLNTVFRGATTDGTSAWFVYDRSSVEIALGYRLSDGARDGSKDIDLSALTPSGSYNFGVTFGTTHWFADVVSGQTYARAFQSTGNALTADFRSGVDTIEASFIPPNDLLADLRSGRDTVEAALTQPTPPEPTSHTQTLAIGATTAGSWLNTHLILDPEFVVGRATAYLILISITAAGVARVVTGPTGSTGTALDAGPELVPAWEGFSRALTLDNGNGYQIVIPGPNHEDTISRDTTEPYQWTVPSAGISAWLDDVHDNNRQVSATFALPVPAGNALTADLRSGRDTIEGALSLPINELTADLRSGADYIRGFTTQPGGPALYHTLEITTADPDPYSGISGDGYVIGRGGSIRNAAYTAPSSAALSVNFLGAFDADKIRLGFPSATADDFPTEVLLRNGDLYTLFRNPEPVANRGLGQQRDYVRAAGDRTSAIVLLNEGSTVTAELYYPLNVLTADLRSGADTIEAALTPISQLTADLRSGRDTIEGTLDAPGALLADLRSGRDTIEAELSPPPPNELTADLRSGADTIEGRLLEIVSGAAALPPVARAGSLQTVASGAVVTLDGTGSYDPGGGPLTYRWGQLSGPIIELRNIATPTPEFTAPSGLAVSLAFELTVTKPATVLTAKSRVSVIVNATRVVSPTRLLEAAFAQETDEALFVLVTISHEDMPDDIRLVNNTENITSRGLLYVAFPFDIELPSDSDESPPLARIVFSNVDRRIVEAARTLRSAPYITMEILKASDLESVEVSHVNFRLKDLRITALNISGRIVLDDIQTEQYPSDSFTPSGFPGLR